ncbi:MAG: SCO1664 family protein [Chloroflexi bacterium]|nr:SCO1664 family protein [Chloroflexota bacterium]
MDTAVYLPLLQLGTMEIEGLLPWSSNYSFLARICPNEAVNRAIGREEANRLGDVQVVYKPRRGERPLWDFPQGTLYQRERAAFVMSEALGWNLVPPTIVRNAEHGIGSVQLFIDHDPECHYLTFEGEPAFARPLQQITLFDVLINNADRKAGHVLVAEQTNPDIDGRLWIIDHGICFHSEYKLRTVIWEFAGLPIPAALLADLQQLLKNLTAKTELHHELEKLLSRREFVALKKRTQQIFQSGKHIVPGPGRHYPWPPV